MPACSSGPNDWNVISQKDHDTWPVTVDWLIADQSFYSAASLKCHVSGTDHDTHPVAVHWHRADQSFYSAASLKCHVPCTGHDTTTPVTVYWHSADQSALSIYLPNHPISGFKFDSFKMMTTVYHPWNGSCTIVLIYITLFWIRLTTQTIHSLVASLMRLILSAQVTCGKIYRSTTTSTSSVFNRTLSQWICGRLVYSALYAEDTRFESSIYWFQ